MTNETPPPIGRSWPRLYTFVLLFLAAEVLLFTLFTKAFQ
jgi:hypothetical protein